MAEQQPMYRAYTVVDRERDAPFWLNIGVAFAHKDAKGLTLMLQALPLNGKLVLRLYGEEQKEGKMDPWLIGKKKMPQATEEV
jgi:hypothetical protein